VVAIKIFGHCIFLKQIPHSMFQNEKIKFQIQNIELDFKWSVKITHIFDANTAKLKLNEHYLPWLERI